MSSELYNVSYAVFVEGKDFQDAERKARLMVQHRDPLVRVLGTSVLHNRAVITFKSVEKMMDSDDIQQLIEMYNNET